MILFLDIETAGVEDLRLAGVYRYAETARILLVQLAIDNGPVRVWDWSQDKLPSLQSLVDEAREVVIHNWEFDATMLRRAGLKLPRSKIYCTMSQARRHGLVGGLAPLSEIYRLGDSSKAEGKSFIHLFCKPQRDGSFFDAFTHPQEWQQFRNVYAVQDIIAMRELYHRLPRVNNEVEQPIFELDQIMNERGFTVDVEFARKAVKLLQEDSTQLRQQVSDATYGMVDSGSQRDRLLAYILAMYGVQLPDLTRDTLERRLRDEALPEPVKELLRLRLKSSRTSTAKYSVLLRSVSSDGRLRGVKVYCGAARTGRWSAQRFQSDNLPRPTLAPQVVRDGIRAIKLGVFEQVMDEPVSQVCAEALRGTVIAAPEHKLLVADLANIEGRVTAWLAGEEWKLQAFVDYDHGTGPDLYKLAYSRMFRVPPKDVEGPARQIGKVTELMLGYGGGVGAFLTGAMTYRIDLAAMASLAWPRIARNFQVEAEMAYARAADEGKTFDLPARVYATCHALSRLWRSENSRIAAFWGDLELAFKRVAQGAPAQVVGRLHLHKSDNWVFMRLPSGRSLCYPSVRMEGGKLTFAGVSPYSRRWSRIPTWGGTLVENAAQAIARDVLAAGLLNAEAQQLRPVMHVHDEIICETPLARGATVQDLVNCMTNIPAWAEGLPLSAKGFETDRYYKEP